MLPPGGEDDFERNVTYAGTPNVEYQEDMDEAWVQSQDHGTGEGWRAGTSTGFAGACLVGVCLVGTCRCRDYLLGDAERRRDIVFILEGHRNRIFLDATIPAMAAVDDERLPEELRDEAVSELRDVHALEAFERLLLDAWDDLWFGVSPDVPFKQYAGNLGSAEDLLRRSYGAFVEGVMVWRLWARGVLEEVVEEAGESVSSVARVFMESQRQATEWVLPDEDSRTGNPKDPWYHEERQEVEPVRGSTPSTPPGSHGGTGEDQDDDPDAEGVNESEFDADVEENVVWIEDDEYDDFDP